MSYVIYVWVLLRLPEVLYQDRFKYSGRFCASHARGLRGVSDGNIVVIECCLYKGVEPNGSGAFIWARACSRF